MKLSYIRFVSFLLALVMLFTGVVELTIPANAAYENTYVNTGDQRKDIVGVALTQVGYSEGAGGYTKYGDWYGSPSMAWCAAFICWCANQANIPTSVIKKNGWANASAFGLASFTAKNRMPQSGDLFFRNSAHTGIVYYVEGNYFYTLEGNTWDSDPTNRVMIRKRDLYSSQYSFASPNYQGSGNSNTGCSHSYVKGADTAHPHKEYYQCSQCGYFYYTGTTKTVDDCKTCIMENCDHSYSDWIKVDDTYHTATCSKCTKVEKVKHDWGNDQVITEATCKDPGLKKQECAKCGATRETEIPATGEHEYSLWLYSDSHSHYRTCEVCKTTENGLHTLTDWKSGAEEHWYECEDCNAKLSIGSHMLSGSCGTTCAICDLAPNSGHMYSAKWSRNAQTHWHRCINCAKTADEKEHEYSSVCDESCDTCGYIRQVTHTYGSQWESDSTGHWVSCTLCGHIKSVQKHTPGAAATEKSAQLCTKCGYEIMPVQAHTHSYFYNYDNASHWGVCSCGATLAAEGHTWQVSNGKCQICQADQPVIEPNPVIFGLKLPAVLKAPWLWQGMLFGMCGLIALIIVIMIASAIRRKVRYSAAVALRREFEEEEALEDDEDTYEEEEASEQDPVPV